MHVSELSLLANREIFVSTFGIYPRGQTPEGSFIFFLAFDFLSFCDFAMFLNWAPLITQVSRSNGSDPGRL